MMKTCGQKAEAGRRRAEKIKEWRLHVGEPIYSFKELRVYQEACGLDKSIFLETQSWPKEERFALIDQVRPLSAFGFRLPISN